MKNYFEYVINSEFTKRYVNPYDLHEYLTKNYSDKITLIGHSTQNLPIFMISLGTGNTQVIAWSQMHGNESTATLAMLDLLELLKKPHYARVLENVKLDFIFMLNPDGSLTWQRRNALDIDLNRDFLQAASIEMQILKKQIFSKKYDYALNLHDQRTIYSTDNENPASISFLAPAFDLERNLNHTRKKAMSIISYIYQNMKTKLPNKIGRYNDEFYPNSTGDNLMLHGLPSILFEGGHFPQDYQRKEVRKYYCEALYLGLSAISMIPDNTMGWEDYFQIPENIESHYDIIYRNVKLNTNFDCILDIAVQYKEVVTDVNNEIDFVPYVVEVGDLSKKFAWKNIDAYTKKFVSKKLFPKLDEKQDFEIE